MAWDHFEYTIAEHFLPALMHGDKSGMTEKEVEQLDWFMKEAREKLPKDTTCSHWATVNDESYFAKCDVTGLGATVSDIHLVFQIPDKKERKGT